MPTLLASALQNRILAKFIRIALKPYVLMKKVVVSKICKVSELIESPFRIRHHLVLLVLKLFNFNPNLRHSTEENHLNSYHPIQTHEYKSIFQIQSQKLLKDQSTTSSANNALIFKSNLEIIHHQPSAHDIYSRYQSLASSTKSKMPPPCKL